MTKNRNFTVYSWAVLAYNLLVIMWGAFVRAMGSGAGCGSHWPLCNGEVIPRAPDTQMLIEFSHRISSGLALLSVVVLVVWAFRAYPKRDGVRLGGLYVAQLLGGAVNVALKAPVPIQLVHLLLSSLIWIVFVLLSNSALANLSVRTEELSKVNPVSTPLAG